MGDRNLKAKSQVKPRGTAEPAIAAKPAPGATTASENQRHEARRDENRGGIHGKPHGRIRDGKDLVKDNRKSHKQGDR